MTFTGGRPYDTRPGVRMFHIVGLLLLTITFCFWLFAGSCFGAKSVSEGHTTIESETLEYDAATYTYTAKGHVKIHRDSATVEAEEVTYNKQSSDVTAKGNVVYEDPDVRIRAKKAELNFETKRGTLYEAEVYSKKDNYHITGKEIEKTGEKEYTLKNASFTTCDAPIPAWCFKGSDVDAIVGDRLKARNVTFNIKGQPVLYSPYFSTSLSRDRKTGFLSTKFGYIKSKGIHVEQPFYWAISDNMDATFIADLYMRRGVGEGIEYRFVEPGGLKGTLWAYHLRDRKLKEDFLDLKGYIDSDRDKSVTGYLNLNYINSRDFNNEYNPYILTKGAFLDPTSYLNLTTGRYFESTGEVALKLDNSRLFLNSQYLVDLQSGVDQSTVAQRLPEAGYFMNPRRIGPVVFSLASTLSDFWRGREPWGQRIDIYPKFAYSFGSDIVIDQSLGLRETAYFLSRNDGFDRSPHRESLDYTIIAHTRLMKKYSSFIHIVEPSLSYTFIPSAQSNLPLFDSTELYTKTSTVQLSVLNRFLDSHGEFLTVRITQPYDSDKTDNSFLPLTIEAAVQRPVGMRGEFTYDVNTGTVESVNSDANLTLANKAVFSVGERYNRTGDILFFTTGVNYPFSKAISLEGSAWYDAKGGGFRDIMAKLKYKKQCWGVDIVVTKREKDYSVSVLFDLLGLGTVKL
jgi:LPS-assembly protein